MTWQEDFEKLTPEQKVWMLPAYMPNKEGNLVLRTELRMQISNTLRGHEMSEDTKAKISKKRLGVGNPFAKSRKHTEEEIEKNRLARVGRTWSEEEKYFRSKYLNSLTEAQKEERLLKSFHSPESREKARNSIRKNFKNMSHEDRMAWVENSCLSPEVIKRNTDKNYFEIRVQKYLDTGFPGEWGYNGKGEYFWYLRELGYGGLKRPDFVNLQRNKVLIDVFGRYWHLDEEVVPRIAHFKKYGFDLMIIWGYEASYESQVVDRIKSWKQNWALGGKEED